MQLRTWGNYRNLLMSRFGLDLVILFIWEILGWIGAIERPSEVAGLFAWIFLLGVFIEEEIDDLRERLQANCRRRGCGEAPPSAVAAGVWRA